MKNKKITRKISQGVYVLTTENGGCVVDAVSQVSSGDNPLISVAVMKSNYTNDLLQNNKYFALSVLSKDVDGEIIKNFGMQSMRDVNKFDNDNTILVQNLNVIKDSIGYMICEIVDMIDTGTHNLFIGKLIEADMFNDKEVLTYGYYQEHKEDYIKVITNNNQTAWVCTVCGYVYYGETLPDGFKCPKCGVPSSLFEKR